MIRWFYLSAGVAILAEAFIRDAIAWWQLTHGQHVTQPSQFVNVLVGMLCIRAFLSKETT